MWNPNIILNEEWKVMFLNIANRAQGLIANALWVLFDTVIERQKCERAIRAEVQRCKLLDLLVNIQNWI